MHLMLNVLGVCVRPKCRIMDLRPFDVVDPMTHPEGYQRVALVSENLFHKSMR